MDIAWRDAFPLSDGSFAQPHDVQEQHLFHVVGKRATETISFVQSVDDVVASYHSRVGFSRERMGSVQAAAFDQEAKETLLKAYPSGMVPFQLRGHVVWGFPKKKEELLFSQPAEMRHRQDIPRYPGSPHAFLEERMPIDNVLMGEARWGAISYACNG